MGNEKMLGGVHDYNIDADAANNITNRPNPAGTHGDMGAGVKYGLSSFEALPTEELIQPEQRSEGLNFRKPGLEYPAQNSSVVAGKEFKWKA